MRAVAREQLAERARNGRRPSCEPSPPAGLIRAAQPRHGRRPSGRRDDRRRRAVAAPQRHHHRPRHRRRAAQSARCREARLCDRRRIRFRARRGSSSAPWRWPASGAGPALCLGLAGPGGGAPSAAGRTRSRPTVAGAATEIVLPMPMRAVTPTMTPTAFAVHAAAELLRREGRELAIVECPSTAPTAGRLGGAALRAGARRRETVLALGDRDRAVKRADARGASHASRDACAFRCRDRALPHRAGIRLFAPCRTAAICITSAMTGA